MSPIALLFALVCAQAPEAPPDGRGIAQLLDQGRFREARVLLGEETDAHRRALGLAELHFRARSFGAALEAARAGLERRPQDLTLLQRAAASALYLRRPGQVRELVQRMEDALDESLEDPRHRDAWEDMLAAFRADCRRLEAEEDARSTCVTRAQVVSAALLLAALLGATRLLLELRARAL
jgi:hypothetical protein